MKTTHGPNEGSRRRGGDEGVRKRAYLRIPAVKAVTRYWGEIVVVGIALLVWLPRLSGPIDLRWDGGVYYLLGSSLAQSHGYRIPSEPGSAEALQYPPLLPAIIAIYQRVLGTSDPAVVAPWLRRSYAAVFLAYSVAVLALARRYLRPGFAVIAAALCLFQVNTIFLSDVLFADLPFALVSVVFVLVAANAKAGGFRLWLREALSFSLAAAGFLFRTAGLALLGAWVLEAIVRRRWWLVVSRGALALLPVVMWNAHVARVRTSYEYAHPAYEYQRAPYQYYNVSYVENSLLIDPFRPELGRLSSGAFAGRVTKNLPKMLVALGETVSTRREYWVQMLDRAQMRLFGRMVIPEGVVFLPLLIVATLVVFGLIVLVHRRAWLVVFVVLGSLSLTCTTPWPAQFTRYLMGLAPFLAIGAVLGVTQIRAALPDCKVGLGSTLGRTALTGLLTLVFIAQTFAALKMFRQRWSSDARSLAIGEDKAGSRLFFHDRTWQAWEDSAAWVSAHASPDAIVATSAPHFFYLCTGVRAVLPPMEPDPERAERLLNDVPASVT